MRSISWLGGKVAVLDFDKSSINTYDTSSPEGKYYLNKLFIMMGALWAGIGLLLLIILNIVFYFTFFSNPEFADQDMTKTMSLSIGIPGIFILLGLIVLAISLNRSKKLKLPALEAENIQKPVDEPFGDKLEQKIDF